MFDSDTWQEIGSSIRAHKLRTALTAFGIFWGIFMLIVLMGIGNGLENGVMENFGDRATNALYVWAEKTSVAYKGLQPGRYIRLNNRDTAALESTFPEIQHLAPRLRLWGEFSVAHGESSGSFTVFGDVPAFTSIEMRSMTAGRFINAFDVSEKRKVAVIGPRVREVLFAPQETAIGAYIRIKGVYFQVIGLFSVESQPGDGRRNAEMIHIPFSTLQSTFNQPDRVGHYAMTIWDTANMGETEKRVKALLGSRHKVSPDDRQAIGSWNSSTEYRQLQGLFRGIRLFLWVVGIGTIMAGVVGVSNIMLIIVRERTREIGLRKALGATPRSIVSLILQESVIITAAAGYLGLVAAVGVIELVGPIMNRIENQYFSRPVVDLRLGLAALLVLVLAGVLAGLFPAVKAANVKPVDALKEE
jgi:putative ABC transport system permease protein